MKLKVILAVAVMASMGLSAGVRGQSASQPASQPAGPVASQPAPDLAAAAHRADLRDPSLHVDVYLENDSIWLKPNAESDRWYTNGIMLSLTHQPVWAQKLLPSLPFADDFANPDQGPVNAAIGYHGAQLMFTPRHINLKAPQPDDQPFAGYLFGGGFIQRANDVTLDHFQLDLGIVGPSALAGDTQRFIHRNFAGDNPRGWDNQLHDEPTLQTYLRKKWRLSIGDISFSDAADSRPLSFQVIPEAGIALGTVYRHFESGVTLRAGFVLPDDFGPGTIANLASATGNGTPSGWSGYGFVGVGGKIVEHNMFLDGSDFHHNPVEVDHKPFTGQVSAGLTINYRCDRTTLALTYSQIFMTREFDRQSGAPAIGTLRFSWSTLF